MSSCMINVKSNFVDTMSSESGMQNFYQDASSFISKHSDVLNNQTFSTYKRYNSGELIENDTGG